MGASMKLSTQGYKGTRDFYPEDKRLQKAVFGQLRQVVENFGYQEYDGPLLEPLEIYKAKSGEELVNEQLYSFTDRGDRQVAIRPEMTPSLARMVAARRQELAYPLRLYSLPNLWRYERPQRGRLREHWQLNIDLFGIEGVAGDHEIMVVADSLLKAFGATADMYSLRFNHRGLLQHFLTDQLGLDAKTAAAASRLIDHHRKMSAADFKAAAKQLLKDAKRVEKLLEFLATKDLDKLPGEPAKELQRLASLLSAADVTSAVFDPSIVRGLDYYTGIVFEVYDTHPDNNRAMFGGGRYDSLIGLFGVAPLPVVGFGMGDVTLQNFLELHKLLPELAPETDAVVILIGDVYEAAQPLLAELRAAGLNLAVDMSGRKLDASIKSAAKSGAPAALFIGADELNQGQLKAKHLASGQEKTFGGAGAGSAIRDWLASAGQTSA